MKLSAILILLLAAPCFLAQEKAPEKQPDLPEGPGKATVVRLCGKCHGLDRFANARKSREDWESIVERMGEAGLKNRRVPAPGSPGRRDMLLPTGSIEAP